MQPNKLIFRFRVTDASGGSHLCRYELYLLTGVNVSLRGDLTFLPFCYQCERGRLGQTEGPPTFTWIIRDKRQRQEPGRQSELVFAASNK